MENVNNPIFRDIPLKLYDPTWGSPLAGTIIELEKLRIKQLGGPVPPYIFFQLKEIFQLLESLESVNIEGNNTTFFDLVDKVIEDPSKRSNDERLKEIFNIDRAINFIEKTVKKDFIFDRVFISEVHKILVEDLAPPTIGEGSRYPGMLRPIDVKISKSNHLPPSHIKVPEYFNELLDFVNNKVDEQYHLLLIALSHHRLAWIHPFDNGNGRLIRMFTYALLIKQGFQVKAGRILNPTAMFCLDRELYYKMLAKADTGTESGSLDWCYYVLDGLRKEIEKIDKLLDLNYITGNILIPALDFALDRRHITKQEYEILKMIVKGKDMCFKSKDIENVINIKSSVQRSRVIKKLKDKKMLQPLKKKGRIYTIGFVNNYLLRGIAEALEKNGFVPHSLNQKVIN